MWYYFIEIKLWRDIMKFEMNVKKLNEKELELINKRYYNEETQSEIATQWGVSQMYVSRLERTTLKKLRDLYFR